MWTCADMGDTKEHWCQIRLLLDGRRVTPHLPMNLVIPIPFTYFTSTDFSAYQVGKTFTAEGSWELGPGHCFLYLASSASIA